MSSKRPEVWREGDSYYLKWPDRTLRFDATSTGALRMTLYFPDETPIGGVQKLPAPSRSRVGKLTNIAAFEAEARALHDRRTGIEPGLRRKISDIIARTKPKGVKVQ